MLKKVLFFFLWMSFLSTSAQNIKTIQLKPLEPNNFSTIVPLGTTLELSFDDLDADQKNYYYKIEHMTFDWKQSDIFSNEYIEGFNQNSIQEIENSFNTLQSYTHYKVRIPNASLKITKSGNYLISILNENDTVLFSRRFTLYESIAAVGVSVTRSRKTTTSNTDQTVQFIINHNAININNPSQEVKVAVLQNNNWESAITNLKPQYYKRRTLEYKYISKSNFGGGNEYLNFDSKIIRTSNVQIARVVQRNIFHSYLYPQEIRAKRPYTYNPDINGQFVIRTLEGSNAETEADYSRVHFALKIPEQLNKNIFVYGAISNFKTSEATKMHFDLAQQMYVGSILLKQGFYNYTFVSKEKNKGIDFNAISGSFFETENEYNVIVYYKAFGANYTRVIGAGTGVINKK